MRVPFGLLASVALAAGVAFAGSDLALRPGEKVAGSIEAGGDVETFRLALPAASVVSVKAKAAKGSAPLRLRLLGPSSALLREATGTKPAISRLAAAETGVHAVEVSAQDGASPAAYSLSVAWSSPKSASVAATVGAGGSSVLTFGAAAGTKATFAVKSGKGSAAQPQLVKLTGPGAVVTPLGPGATGGATLAAFGSFELEFKDGGAAGGALVATAKLVPPKVAKRKIDLTGARVPPGATVLAAATVSKTGGTLVAPQGPLAGASVSVPPGALKKTATLLLGSGTDIEPADGPFEPLGPAVFLGPEGTAFAEGAVATVTLPFDGTPLGGDPAGLALFTRDAAGVVTEIDPSNVDLAAGAVTFETPHFSTFQPMRSKGAIARLRLFHNPFTFGDVPQANEFGAHVALTDDWLAVTSAIDDFSVDGTAYLYPFADGVLGTLQRIIPADINRGDGFASAIAMQGDVLVVGAKHRRAAAPATGKPGSAFVYRLIGGTWQLEQELRGRVDEDLVEFGHAVALDGTRIVVGAPGDFEGLRGAAYVFSFDGANWVEEAQLVSDLSNPFDLFGQSVAISGTTVAVGAANFDVTDGDAPGHVRVFARNAGSGIWEAKDSFDGETPTSDFGASVALSGSFLVVGAPRQSPEGRAFVYESVAGAFSKLAELTGAGPLNSGFGASCAVRGGKIVVGADGRGSRDAPGKAYVFVRDGNQFDRPATIRGQDVDLETYELAIIGNQVENVSPSLGASVAFSGKWLLVGAPQALGGPNEDFAIAGLAFVFELE